MGTEQLIWHSRDDGRIAKIFAHNITRKNRQSNLYIIAEISSPSQDGELLINSLASSVRKAYSESRESAEAAFEDAITQANILIKNMANQTTNTWFGNLHIIVSLAHAGGFFFSTLGEPSLLLLRSGKINEVTKRTKTKEEHTSFNNVFSGNLEEGDVVLMTTPGLLEIFPVENLGHILDRYQGFPVKKLEKLLEENRANIDALFASLAIRIQKRPQEAAQVLSHPSSYAARTVHTKLSVFGTLLNLRPDLLRLISQFTRSFARRAPAVSPRRPPLPKIRPLLIFPVLLLLTLGTWYGLRDHEPKINTNEIINEIRTKMETAENALIFHDNDLAGENILEAKLLLAKISMGSSISQEIQGLEQSLNQLQDQALGTIIIEDPELVWEIKNNLGASPQNFFISGNTFFAYSGETATMYSKGDAEKLIFLPVTNREIQAPGVFFAPRNIFLSYIAGEGLRAFDPARETHRLIGNISNIPQDFEVADVSYYNDYLYLLSSGGIILKYRFSDTGLAFVGEWLKEPLSISSSPSFAIDGSIYVAGGESDVLELANGTISQRWNLPVDIYDAHVVASRDLKYIYIINRGNSSVLKLSKGGEILNQYQSPKFNDLNDIFVDESRNKGYVLSGFKVYEIDL